MNKYIKDLIEKTSKKEQLKYLFFWGHTEKSDLVTKACLSQWYPSSFTVENKVYLTAEHWMMAKKANLFGAFDIEEEILNSVKPGKIKALGRAVKDFDHKVWEEHKFDIVVKGNIHKFTQNENLATFLLDTNERILVEASPLDRIWGIGMAQDHPSVYSPQLWKGENLLGFALMQARVIIKAKHL
jgi:ribA/ribD-fused uncharacterized protein